jgi:DNA polymerase III gamma/tau subunit
MFPNGRLVIVAMLASVVAVSCGLGVFAAFRINHQPFTRLQSADPPLQLVFGSGAPAPVRDVSAAPFGVRFLLNAPVAVPETVSVVSVQQEPTPAADAAVPASQPEAAAGTDSPSTVTAEAPAAAVSADQDAPQQASQQTAEEIEPALGQGTGQETAPDDKTGGAADVALASPSDQTPAADPAVQDRAQPTASKRRIARSRKPSAKATAKAAPERRVVRHFRRTQPVAVAPSAMQGFALTPASQAAFPGAAAQQAPQVVRRGVVVKRHRSANKTAVRAPAGNQTAANGAALATSQQ